MAQSFCNFVRRKKEKCLREGLITNSYPSKSQDGKGISEFACSLVLSMGVSPSPLYIAETSGRWTGFCPQGVHPLVRCNISQKERKQEWLQKGPLGLKGEWIHGALRKQKFLRQVLKVGRGRLTGREKHMKAHEWVKSAQARKPVWVGLLTTKPDIIWAGRLELDIEEKGRMQINWDSCVYSSTIREGGEKAGEQVGYLENASPYLDGHWKALGSFQQHKNTVYIQFNKSGHLQLLSPELKEDVGNYGQ